MKKLSSYLYLVCIAFTISLVPQVSIAQKESLSDNGYYITYPEKLLVRVFLSQKFAPFTVPSQTDKELNYKTNSKLNLGMGATYKSFTLNLGYGFPFLNNNDQKGKTKGLDLQLHIFPNKWAVDVLGTFIKGYYLEPNDNSGFNSNSYYPRTDIKRNLIGFSAFRVPNAYKFSYKAAVTQNEWQKRSAGSLLYGAEIYYGSVKGDSALVPAKVASYFEQTGVTKFNFVSIGPGIGYAYTLVLSRHYFITGSAIAALDLNFSSEEKSGANHTKVNFLPSANYKAAAGYNSGSWSISANILGNALYSGSAFSSKKYFLPTGNFRLTIARKLGIKKA